MSVPPVLSHSRRSFRWLWLLLLAGVAVIGFFVYSSLKVGRTAVRMARTTVVDEDGRTYVLSEMQWDHGVLIADTFFDEIPTTRGDLRVTGANINDPSHPDSNADYDAEKPIDVLVHPKGRTKEYQVRFPTYKGHGGESLRLMIYWKGVDDPNVGGASGCDVQIPPKPR